MRRLSNCLRRDLGGGHARSRRRLGRRGRGVACRSDDRGVPAESAQHGANDHSPIRSAMDIVTLASIPSQSLRDALNISGNLARPFKTHPDIGTTVHISCITLPRHDGYGFPATGTRGSFRQRRTEFRPFAGRPVFPTSVCTRNSPPSPEGGQLAMGLQRAPSRSCCVL